MDADFESVDLPDTEWEESDNSWSHWLAKQFDSSGFHGMFRRVTFCAFMLACLAGFCLWFARPKERRALPLSAIGLHEVVTQDPSNHEIYRLRARVTQSQYEQYVSRLGLDKAAADEISSQNHWTWIGPDKPSWWQLPQSPAASQSPTASQSHARIARNCETHTKYVDGSVYVVRVTY